IKMFIDEAKIAVQLNHANIAQIFDLGKAGEAFFIALEYIHGKDLRAIFDRCRANSEVMPVPQACFSVMKVCEGLDYAHNKRDASGREMHLVHRDVSPQNILVSYEGEVKLVDFGIAKAAGKASKTQAGILKGKFGYMSPEQVRGLPLDRRSDIFSVGIILYELLTGERLFLGETDFSTLEKVRNVEILPPSTYNRKIGDDLEQIVMRALAKDVEDRYQNAIDLHDDLHAYLYASGEFYSRKDLAAWQKRTFAREIEEEGRKIEAYRQMPEPGRPVPEDENDVSAHSDPVRREPTADFAPPRRKAGPEMAPRPSLDDSPSGVPSLTWDDDEIDTQIYDKPVLPDEEEAQGAGTPEYLPRSESSARPAVPRSRHTPAKPGKVPPPIPIPIPGAAVASRRDMSAGKDHALSQRPGLVPPPVAKTPEKRGFPLGLIVSVLLAVLLGGGGAYYFLIYANRPGQLVISSSPRDVEISLDGRRQAGKRTPLKIDHLKPGFYIVAARKEGYQRWEKTVEIGAGQTVTLTPTLVAMPSVELRTIPSGAIAYLDGQELPSRTPMKISRIAPGRRRIEVRLPPKYQPTIEEFDIAAGEVKKLSLRLLPRDVVVVIRSVPGGDVFIEKDGHSERYGRTPLTIKLDPKLVYRLTIRRDRFEDWSRPITFMGEQAVRIDARLQKRGKQPTVVPNPVKPTPVKPTPVKPTPVKPKPVKPTPVKPKPVKPKPVKPKPVKPKPVAKGWLMINSTPWTRIIIDGRATRLTTPQKKLLLRAGRHTITLRNRKFAIETTMTVYIRSNRGTKVIKRFRQ
ncbi:MAG: serine/threonine protein kinase, partial [Deltaproteobacteria bacterium]|nr:serine/threonine protein kinase [Deltaproteobacteria bacterium]